MSWNDNSIKTPDCASQSGDARNDGGAFGETYHEHGRDIDGECWNCCEKGHYKAECTNARVFRDEDPCGKLAHRTSDSPSAPTKTCKNCGEENHTILECKNARIVDRSHIADMPPEEAWAAMMTAVVDRDIDDVKEAFAKYVKALPLSTYLDIEKGLRLNKIPLYLIATERELGDTYTNMDLQGNLDKKFSISFRFSDKPQRPKEKEGWPSPKENMERLADCGEPVDRGIPKCSNCEEMGHIAKFCEHEKSDSLCAVVQCYNCEGLGHRVRDCPKPRPDRFTCRNCGKSGHDSKECPEPRDETNVECRKCGEMGHSGKNCPQGGGSSGPRMCFNCGEEGHNKNDCTNEHVDICRNCDAQGHLGRDCPKPRDYSRVKCINCSKMGHTKVRCKEPLKEENGGNAGYGGAADGTAHADGDDGNDAGFGDTTAAYEEPIDQGFGGGSGTQW